MIKLQLRADAWVHVHGKHGQYHGITWSKSGLQIPHVFPLINLCSSAKSLNFGIRFWAKCRLGFVSSHPIKKLTVKRDADSARGSAWDMCYCAVGAAYQHNDSNSAKFCFSGQFHFFNGFCYIICTYKFVLPTTVAELGQKYKFGRIFDAARLSFNALAEFIQKQLWYVAPIGPQKN